MQRQAADDASPNREDRALLKKLLRLQKTLPDFPGHPEKFSAQWGKSLTRTGIELGRYASLQKSFKEAYLRQITTKNLTVLNITAYLDQLSRRAPLILITRSGNWAAVLGQLSIEPDLFTKIINTTLYGSMSLNPVIMTEALKDTEYRASNCLFFSRNKAVGIRTTALSQGALNALAGL